MASLSPERSVNPECPVQKMEEAPFMGDSSFHRLPDEMAGLSEPLIRFDTATSTAEITEAGQTRI